MGREFVKDAKIGLDLGFFVFYDFLVIIWWFFVLLDSSDILGISMIVDIVVTVFLFFVIFLFSIIRFFMNNSSTASYRGFLMTILELFVLIVLTVVYFQNYYNGNNYADENILFSFRRSFFLPIFWLIIIAYDTSFCFDVIQNFQIFSDNKEQPPKEKV